MRSATSLTLTNAIDIVKKPDLPSSEAAADPAPAGSQFKSKSGWRRVLAAFFYSMDGFKAAWRNEHAFRQELLLCLAGTLIAIFLPVSIYQKLLLVAVLILVLIVELINSAIEATIDRISLERHAMSKNAKDFGSASVFLTLALAALAWIVVLVDRFY